MKKFIQFLIFLAAIVLYHVVACALSYTFNTTYVQGLKDGSSGLLFFLFCAVLICNDLWEEKETEVEY